MQCVVEIQIGTEYITMGAVPTIKKGTENQNNAIYTNKNDMDRCYNDFHHCEQVNRNA